MELWRIKESSSNKFQIPILLRLFFLIFIAFWTSDLELNVLLQATSTNEEMTKQIIEFKQTQVAQIKNRRVCFHIFWSTV